MKLNQYIDHTALGPEVDEHKVHSLCDEALKYEFCSVCVPPYYVKQASTLLDKAPVNVCTVVGFPHGNTLTSVKAFETRVCIDNGANEIDMVLNIAELQNGNFAAVQEDIATVIEAAAGRIVKVIIEACLLSHQQIEKACQLIMDAKAHYVKTSTGFSKFGAKVEHIELIKRCVGENIKIKASGGIKDRETALKMIDAGATRLGTSSSISLIN